MCPRGRDSDHRICLDKRNLNIAVVAPAKFEFQDLATVELGLRWPTGGTPSFRVEPLGGEDAELTWTEGGDLRHCEIQVKGRTTSEFSMATLAEYLAHFPDKQDSNCLLDRLLADPERRALFVVSERCRDDVATLRTPLDWTGSRRAAKGSATSGKALRVELLTLSKTPDRARTKEFSELELRRHTHIGELAQVDPALLTEALQRVFIHESETPATITARLHQRLHAVGIPMDRLADGVSRLKSVVSENRPARQDIFGRLRTVLNELAPERMAQSRYLPRGNEAAFSDMLSRDGVILLSGPPRVGKSWMAMELAGRLQQQGYEVTRSSHIDHADRFLSDPAAKFRAYLLEDPLGARDAVADVSKRIAELARLAGALPGNRRLIVAQTEAPILQAHKRSNLSDCCLAKFPWMRLDALSADQAETLWRRDASDAGLADEDIAKVASMTRHRPEMRDAGALAYLATSFYRLPAHASEGQILSQARGDAADFAQSLADETPEAGSVLRGIAIAAESGSGIQDAELAFVIGGNDDRPSFDQSNGIHYQPDDGPTIAPSYAVPPVLSKAATDASQLLRRRRVILTEAGGLNFVHPYFRSGAQALVRPDLEEDLTAVVSEVERALASPNPRISLATARNLDWITGAVCSLQSGAALALELAETSLKSVFPATRDACFEFLMTRAGDIPSGDDRRLDRWVDAVDVDWDQIEEAGDVLVITTGMNSLLRKRPVIELTSVQPFIDAIIAGQAIDLNLPIAHRIITAYEQHAQALPKGVVERLLSADSAVIRAKVSAGWLADGKEEDADTLLRISNDAVPAVSNAILDLLARTYDAMTDERREAAVRVLERHVHNSGSATVLLRRLSKFSRKDEFGAMLPWSVFARLAPAALRNAPNAVFNDGRLVTTIEEAIDAGAGEDLRPLFDIWAERVLLQLDANLPDEWELAISEAVLAVGDVDWRWAILQRLLGRPNTGARLRIIANLVDRWSSLSAKERDGVMKTVLENAYDGIWLRAAALTRREVPPEVQLAIGGREDLLTATPPDLFRTLGEPLYSACLHVYLGVPQPLWWLGSHHASSAAWSRAALWSAGSSQRPVFEEALANTISLEDDENVLVSIVSHADPAQLPEYFSVFLKQKITENGNWRRPVWIALLDRGAEAGLLDDWMSRLGDAAPLFLDGLSELREWFGNSPHGGRMLRQLESDLNAYRVLEAAASLASKSATPGPDGAVAAGQQEAADEGLPGDLTSADHARSLTESIRIWLEARPPRLHDTWHRLVSGFKALSASKETVTWLEEQRIAVLDRKQTDRRLVRAEDQSALAGWTGPR